MFKILADESALLLISHKIIDEENRDAYTYGLELFFEKAFLYAIIFIIAIFTKTILFSIAFIITYKALRQYTGGFHCKTAEMCLVISILIYLIALLIFLFKPRALEFILATGTIVSAIVIFIFSPIENANRPLDIAEKKKYRIISIGITAVAAIAVALSYNMGFHAIFYSFSFSLTADAVMIILSLGGNKCEKDDSESFGESS